MASVKIGPEFFKKIKLDYTDWKWALVREFAQNSCDAGSRNIVFTLTTDGAKTTLTVENDGRIMSEEILVGKLLALGGSDKDLGGATVGGFGVAKSLLYFCHDSYSIQSGNLQVIGSGADYELTTDAEFSYVDGTRSQIVLDGNLVDDLVSAIQKFIVLGQTACTIIINQPLGTLTERPSLAKGSFRREFDFGKVYTNKTGPQNTVIARINGMPMFVKRTPFNRCVILELTDSKVLTSNRDGLTGEANQQLTNFLTALVVDKRSALKNPVVTVTRYVGNRLKAKSRYDDEDTNGESQSATEAQTQTAAFGAATNRELSTGSVNWETVYERRSPLDFGIYIKNETSLKIPEYLLPESFSKYGQRLIEIWSKIMVKMHEIQKDDAAFVVGFIFSEDAVAQYAKEDGEPAVYYLSPCEVIKQVCSESRSFKTRWKLTQRNHLLAIAAHEYLHKQYTYHDENYAAALTDLMAVVMENRKSFNSCFVSDN